MHKNPQNFILNLWEKSAGRKRLTFFENIIFLILCILEKFYIPIFWVTQFLKRKKGNKEFENLKVISIGNLSVGGTGKSVFAGFLVQILGYTGCAIISRGYGGSRVGGSSFLVGDGKKIFCTANNCGDEPYMLALTTNIPVVVGKDRLKSCLLLRDVFSDSIKYGVIDDGYQNHKLKKHFEILLLDARSPFGNGHCLPAGPLRERDYSRASVIILTHADEVNSEQISKIKKQLYDFDQNKIFCGRHKQDDLFLFNEKRVSLEDCKNKKFLVIAGIGAFSGFVRNIKQTGICVAQVLQFPDHHIYLQDDVEEIFKIVKQYCLDGVITTQKDWVKLDFLIEKKEAKEPIFVSRVTFEFLTKHEEESFKKCLNYF